ncbi:hypothetical protein JCM5296_006138 [Sporobolomyces johnsonii]
MLARLNLLRSPRSAAIAPVIRTSRLALAAPFARSPLSRQLHLSRPLLGPSVASPSEYSKPIRCPSCHAPLPDTVTLFCSACSGSLVETATLLWRPSKRTAFDIFNFPMSYEVDQEKLEVEYSLLKEKLDLKDEYSDRKEDFDPAKFIDRWRRSVSAQDWRDRVDDAYSQLSDDLTRALYILKLLGVDPGDESTWHQDLTNPEVDTEICEVGAALDAAASAEEIAAIRKTSAERFNETLASLAPAFAATLASDTHDVQPLCSLVLRLQYLYNVEQYCVEWPSWEMVHSQRSVETSQIGDGSGET